MDGQSRDAINQALNDFNTRIPIYRLMRDYYDGRHRFGFATEKYTNIFRRIFTDFRSNLCPAVVDAVTDRLVLEAFAIEGATDDESGPDPDSPEDRLWAIWNANRMDQRAGELHNEAVTCGDAYAIVWPDEQDANGPPRIWVNNARNVTVFYDPDRAGSILWAAKQWTSYGRIRLNLYFADRIEKYITTGAPPQGHARYAIPDLPEKGEAFVEYTGPDSDEDPHVRNEYGRVPVFHFANNGRIGSFGKSELWDAVPLQDALNKTLIDALVGAEFMAYPQRYISGIEIEYDEETGQAKPLKIEPGVDRIWGLGDGQTAGQFPAADLGGLKEQADDFRMDMVRVTATPMHYIVQMGTPPSGEALQTMESRFVKKVTDRQIAFGNGWEDVMSFIAAISGIGKGIALEAQWKDPASRSELEHMQSLTIMRNGLGLPDSYVWKKAGLSSEEIEQYAAEKQASVAQMGLAMTRQFDSGQAAGQPAQGD